VLFLGNLPFYLNEQEIENHFECVKKHGAIKQVRLLRHKTTNEPKGCAFIEFDTAAALKTALKMHHSVLRDRKINVELTAGGGGNNKNRKSKLHKRNGNLHKQRKQHFAKKVLPEKKSLPKSSAPQVETA